MILSVNKAAKIADGLMCPPDMFAMALGQKRDGETVRQRYGEQPGRIQIATTDFGGYNHRARPKSTNIVKARNSANVDHHAVNDVNSSCPKFGISPNSECPT